MKTCSTIPISLSVLSVLAAGDRGAAEDPAASFAWSEFIEKTRSDARSDTPPPSGFGFTNSDLTWSLGIGVVPIFSPEVETLRASPPDDWERRLLRGLAEPERFAVCHVLLVDCFGHEHRYGQRGSYYGLSVWWTESGRGVYTTGDIPYLRDLWARIIRHAAAKESWQEYLPFTNADVRFDERGRLQADADLRAFMRDPPYAYPELKRGLLDPERFAASHIALIQEFGLPVVIDNNERLFGLRHGRKDGRPTFDFGQSAELYEFWETATALRPEDLDRFRRDAAAGTPHPIADYDTVSTRRTPDRSPHP